MTAGLHAITARRRHLTTSRKFSLISGTVLFLSHASADDAFVGGTPAYQYLRAEIIEMVGQPTYDKMVIQLERPQWTPLPHPAVKRR